MGDEFQKLANTALDELSQVFRKMNEASVRPLLESIPKAPRIFLLGAGREGHSPKTAGSPPSFEDRRLDSGGLPDGLHFRRRQPGTNSFGRSLRPASGTGFSDY